MGKNTEKITIQGDGALVVKRAIEVITASKTLTEEDSAKVFLVGTDALTITLPKIADMEPGVYYTFINIGADAAVALTLSPNAADGINGPIANAAADSDASGGDGKDLVNTKATANQGDRVTIVSDGEADWFILEGVGIWASEA